MIKRVCLMSHPQTADKPPRHREEETQNPESHVASSTQPK